MSKNISVPYTKRDNLISGTKERHKYTGHELDEDTGYTYAKARYLNTDTGRFSSQDPMFWKLSKGLLVDPQQQNSYSYARNNPIIFTDPTGELTIMIPGTWADYANNWNYSGGTAVPFLNKMSEVFREPVSIAQWSGGDNSNARTNAGQGLADYISNYKFAEGEKLNFITHSHGGNVLSEAMRFNKDMKIDNLVSLALPVLDDYQFDQSRIGSFVNTYSTYDKTQNRLAGNISSVSGGIGALAGFMTCGLPCAFLGYAVGQRGIHQVEFGFAGREVSGTINKNITNYVTNNSGFFNNDHAFYLDSGFINNAIDAEIAPNIKK